MNKELKIFFILADARSGTTFLANNIIKKLNVLIIPETNFVIRLLQKPKHFFNSKKQLVDFLYEENKFYDLKIQKKELKNNLTNIYSVREIILDILKIYYSKNKGKHNCIGIKKGYLYFLDEIMYLFPNAKIFNIIRDCRAVYSSKKSSIYSKISKPFLTNPFEAAKIWNEKTNIIIRSKKKYNASVFFYEDIIKDLNSIIKKISKILNLSLKNSYIKKKGYYVSKIYNEKLHSNINLPPKLDNVDKWKKNLVPHEIFCIEFLARKNLKKFNYKLKNEKNEFENYLYLYIFFMKYFFSKFNPFKLYKNNF